MADLPTYQFPMRPDDGVLLGLTPARLVAVGLAGVVLIVTMLAPTLAGLIVGGGLIVTLLGLAAVRVGGRVAIHRKALANPRFGRLRALLQQLETAHSCCSDGESGACPSPPLGWRDVQ